MAILTCKNHPNLRWSCKDIAVSESGTYNGTRSIFFNGEPTGKGMYYDGSGLHCARYIEELNDEGKFVKFRPVTECSCTSDQLILAPEDKLVKR